MACGRLCGENCLMQHVIAGSWQLADLAVSDLTGKKLWPMHLPSNGPSLQDAPVSRRHNRKDVVLDYPRTCRTLVLADLNKEHACMKTKWRCSQNCFTYVFVECKHGLLPTSLGKLLHSWHAGKLHWENCFTHDMHSPKKSHMTWWS